MPHSYLSFYSGSDRFDYFTVDIGAVVGLEQDAAKIPSTGGLESSTMTFQRFGSIMDNGVLTTDLLLQNNAVANCVTLINCNLYSEGMTTQGCKVGCKVVVGCEA